MVQVTTMANPNWHADFDKAWAEEDHDDPTSNSVFRNRRLAWRFLIGGLIMVPIVFLAHEGAASTSQPPDFRQACERVAVLGTLLVPFEIAISAIALYLNPKPRPAAPPPPERPSSSPPIGW
jgi:hypothetical protein